MVMLLKMVSSIQPLTLKAHFHQNHMGHEDPLIIPAHHTFYCPLIGKKVTYLSLPTSIYILFHI